MKCDLSRLVPTIASSRGCVLKKIVLKKSSANEQPLFPRCTGEEKVDNFNFFFVAMQ